MSVPLSILFSVFHLLTFWLYTRNYARLRKNDRYSQGGKAPVEKMPLARKITKVAFVWSTFFVLVSFWVQNEALGFYQTAWPLRLFGLLLTFCAFLGLKKSLNQLGENYSPLFDTHKPNFIVKEGPYRYIRHPVYLCNILIILGYVISSSSLWVLASSLWGWGYMIRSILKEEAFLSKEFPNYTEYQKKTWRIIPLVF